MTPKNNFYKENGFTALSYIEQRIFTKEKQCLSSF